MTDIISILISVVGFVLALYIYIRDRSDKTKKDMAKNIVAYYAVEEEAIKLLIKESNGKYSDRMKLKTLLRNAAEKNDEFNPNHFRPTLSAKSVNRYL